MLPVCLSSLPRCFTSPCQACKGSCTLPPCIRHPTGPSICSSHVLERQAGQLMHSVQPAHLAVLLYSRLPMSSMSSRVAALTAPTGAAIAVGLRTRTRPHALTPDSQKRKALLFQYLCSSLLLQLRAGACIRCCSQCGASCHPQQAEGALPLLAMEGAQACSVWGQRIHGAAADSSCRF